MALFLFAVSWSASATEPEKPGYTDYKADGTVKSHGVIVSQDDHQVKMEIFDGAGRMELVVLITYDEGSGIIRKKRYLPDGKKWPYGFDVYGAAALGGLDGVKEDIEAIQAAVGDEPILEILFLKADGVEVKTGSIRGPQDGSGRYYDFKKEKGRWVPVNRNTFRAWAA